MVDSPDLGVERTLVLLKPDAVARGLAGRIITRFEDAALKIVGVKMRHIDADFNHRCRDQNIQMVFAKCEHRLLFFIGIHLPMKHRDAQSFERTSRQSFEFLFD